MIAENGQGKASFYYHLEQCCQLVSETYGKPERTEWTNSDYVRLSHILFRKTGVQISPNTLKRIFGKIKTDSRYYPQRATRDALASYVGYPDWEKFVEAQLPAEPFVENPIEETLQTPVDPPKVVEQAAKHSAASKKWFWLIGLAAVTLAIIVLLLPKRAATDSTGTEQVQLVCKNPIGENPHSANFELLKFDPLADKNYVIDFGDGKHKAVEQSTKQYNHYYEKPGRYLAILKQGSRNLDTATVYLPTKGWAATAYMMYDTTRVYPIEVSNLFVTGKRSINPSEAARAGIDTNRTYFIEFTNTHPTDIDGDNFELTANVITSPTRPGVRCSQVDVTVYGESSKHSFELIKPGCVYWTHIQLSEKVRAGQQEDLSFLGADLRKGGALRFVVVKQRAKLYVDGKKVYEAPYIKPLHRVYGVNIRFSGVGTINAFALKDLKTGKVFDGSF